MSYNQGHIVLVPFPFTNLSTTKQRPALVISPDYFNTTHQDIILTAITSSYTVPQDSTDISLDQSDLISGNIPKKSIIKTTKLFTCDSKMIIKKIAILKECKLIEVLDKLRDLFKNP